ncbi:E3 ubiquitin protein ligase DRIP2-like isoform X1 [Primulina tabacum]|uniref:E3 ubiquitin protein ligase DRIP2-like isoform X1 n=2 Tax=Primulina tabacum TaxID=48773 RepID=UPI003F5A3A6F
MPNQVVKAKRGSVASCMTCPLCHKLFRDATTIIECLHTFCRKCIFKKLSDEEMDCCPVCDIDLGCAPLEKLRPDHNLQDIRAKIFPYKKALEVVTPVTFPAKRKERSLSSLVVSTPRVSMQSGMTGRRSKSIARKASRGSSFIAEKHFRKEEESSDHPESSSSREILTKFTQIARKKSTAAEPSDKGGENRSELWEGRLDLWKPLTCLVDAANRSKSSKFTTQVSATKSESHEIERELAKTKNKENRLKSKVQTENSTLHSPQESVKPKKLRRGRQKKGENSGEFRVPPQVLLEAACARFDQKNHPVWFSLVASDEQDGDAPLPQITSSYLRIKDGSVPVSLIKKYLKLKLDLASENEVEIKCMGQTVIPTLTLNNLVELWLQTTGTERASANIGSSAKDFVMVLCYARKFPAAS